MPGLDISLLGGFDVRLAPGRRIVVRRQKACALLAYLAMHGNRPQARDKLVALLWSDTGEREGRLNLRQVLHTLRQALQPADPPPLIVDGATVMFDPAGADVDVVRFERLVGEGGREALEAAADLYRGDLLEGMVVNEPEFEDWLRFERERLRETARRTLTALLSEQERAGDRARAIETGVRLLALDALQEDVHRTLMRLHLQQGRAAAAARQYDICAELLRRELGVEPDAETVRLYRQVRASAAPADRGSASLPAARASRPRGHMPTRRPPAESTPLIGRATETRRLRGILDDVRRGDGRVAFVTGEAGIGKTRLVDTVVTEAAARAMTVYEARCYEIERLLPFHPWIEALRHGGAIEAVARDGGFAAVWRSELAQLFPELHETERLPPPVAVEDDLRLFEAVARLLERLASRRPVIVILEDVHWADDMTVRLVSFLARRRPVPRVLVVATSREEELARDSLLHALLGRPAETEQIDRLALAPLDRAGRSGTGDRGSIARPGTPGAAGGAHVAGERRQPVRHRGDNPDAGRRGHPARRRGAADPRPRARADRASSRSARRRPP